MAEPRKLTRQRAKGSAAGRAVRSEERLVPVNTGVSTAFDSGRGIIADVALSAREAFRMKFSARTAPNNVPGILRRSTPQAAGSAFAADSGASAFFKPSAGTASNPELHASYFDQLARLSPSLANQFLSQLQGSHGNRYVQRMVDRTGEQESEVSAEVEAGIQSSRGNGQPLDKNLQGQMESAFDADFGNVRVHTDEGADRLSRDVGAVAFTTGSDIYFRQGQYDSASAAGRELLAHELTHVIQQGGVAAAGKLELGEPDDRFEQEADHVAEALGSADDGNAVFKAGTSNSGTPMQRQCACGGSSEGECEACKKRDADTIRRLDVESGAAAQLSIQRRVVCPEGVDPEEGTGCYETADDQSSSPPASSPAPAADDGGFRFTPAPGGYSSDPMQGGSSQASPPSDGGFTPAPGARSYDPDSGGSSQAPPQEENSTPSQPYSTDPMQGGSSQAPPVSDGGFTPVPGAQSKDPLEGGSSQEAPCSIARRSPAYQQAMQKADELGFDLKAAQVARDQAKKLALTRCFPSGQPDPTTCANGDWEVQRTQALYDAASFKLDNAYKGVKDILKAAGCDASI